MNREMVCMREQMRLQEMVAIGDNLVFSVSNGGCTYGSPSVWVKEISVAGK